MEIKFSPSYDKVCNKEYGIRRNHVVEAITHHDKKQDITDKHIIYTKKIDNTQPPYILIIVASFENNILTVTEAYKAYFSLYTSSIANLEPVKLLELLAKKFGLPLSIGGSIFKRFFYNEKIQPMNSLMIDRNNIVRVDIPGQYTPFISVTLFKFEDGKKTINCALALTIETNPYVEWLKNKGEDKIPQQIIDSLLKFTKEVTLPKIQSKPFEEKVFHLIHDFCFFCRQTPDGINTLREEQIRNMLLVNLKTEFTHAEGEAYNFDGKLDFKVVNPENKYEIINGELKWWTDKNSATELFKQATQKHFTGQEIAIYTIILNRNKDAKNVFKTVSDIFLEEDAIAIKKFEPCAPSGSKELVAKTLIDCSEETIPLYLFLNNLYHKKV